jgi:hypothetical protein
MRILLEIDRIRARSPNHQGKILIFGDVYCKKPALVRGESGSEGVIRPLAKLKLKSIMIQNLSNFFPNS